MHIQNALTSTQSFIFHRNSQYFPKIFIRKPRNSNKDVYDFQFISVLVLLNNHSFQKMFQQENFWIRVIMPILYLIWNKCNHSHKISLPFFHYTHTHHTRPALSWSCSFTQMSLICTCSCNKYDKLFHNNEKKKKLSPQKEKYQEMGKTCHFLTVH